MLTGLLIVAAVTAGILVSVAGFVFLADREYDRHPLVKIIIDSFARITPGYYTPPAAPPGTAPGYMDQMPGEWDRLAG